MTDPATDTETATTTDTQPETTEQPRRLLKFVKNEPGHYISVTVNMLFLANGLLFAFFAVISILMPSGTADEIFDLMDIVGISLFCLWNSIVLNLIILFPSITTINREKNLIFFYLNGLTVVFIRLSDFSRPLTRFQNLISIIMNICAYLLYMALFCVFYGMPEELHQISRTISMRPWKPVYEGDPENEEASEELSNRPVIF